MPAKDCPGAPGSWVCQASLLPGQVVLGQLGGQGAGKHHQCTMVQTHPYLTKTQSHTCREKQSGYFCTLCTHRVSDPFCWPFAVPRCRRPLQLGKCGTVGHRGTALIVTCTPSVMRFNQSLWFSRLPSSNQQRWACRGQLSFIGGQEIYVQDVIWAWLPTFCSASLVDKMWFWGINHFGCDCRA